MKYALTIFFVMFITFTYSQTDPPPQFLEEKIGDENINLQDDGSGTFRGTNQKTISSKKDKPPITDYKIISVNNDTTFVDTTLTIYKDYKWNYLRKDDFELVPFANVGQPYNILGYNFEKVFIDPEFGARSKHFNHYEVEDVSYYNTPTPHTELFYKTVLQQGQTLEALFTSNTSPNLNFFVGYKGLRSLGKYQSSLASTGNLKLGFTFNTKNQRYYIKTHFTAQDYTNEENGGLTAEANQQYIDEISEFEDRSLLEVNFQDSESALDSRRFYMDHQYYIIRRFDSIPTSTLSIGHKLTFIDKEYSYIQDSPFEGYGDSFESSNLNDLTEFQNVSNIATLNYALPKLGSFTAKAGYTNFNYGYNRTLNIDSGFIGNRLIGNILKAGGEYRGVFGKLNLNIDFMTSLSGDEEGNYLKAQAKYQVTDDIAAMLKVSNNDHAVNYNFRLYQSDYISYNWQNEFSNESIQDISAEIKSKKYGTLSLSHTTINDYAFFALNADSLIKPFQSTETINYLKANFQNTIDLGLFGITNTVQYQNVSSGDDVFNVPQVITRHSIYYQDYWFKKALYLQTGFTGKYFSSYNSNGYDPVLSEYYVQNETELDGFPVIDFFFNAKIRQTRIFFKVENAYAIVEGNNNFTGPSYPYRDFVIRFGLVWDFFL